MTPMQYPSPVPQVARRPWDTGSSRISLKRRRILSTDKSQASLSNRACISGLAMNCSFASASEGVYFVLHYSEFQGVVILIRDHNETRAYISEAFLLFTIRIFAYQIRFKREAEFRFRRRDVHPFK